MQPCGWILKTLYQVKKAEFHLYKILKLVKLIQRLETENRLWLGTLLTNMTRLIWGELETLHVIWKDGKVVT